MSELQAVPNHLASGTLAPEVLVEDEDFRALEEEWAELYERSPRATPFQSWGWLYSWWEHYGADYELRLVTVRDEDGLLLGLLPLMLDPSPLGGRLLLLGNSPYSAPYSSYLDVVARGGYEARVARSGAEALYRMGGWRVADLQELRPEAAAWELFRRWSGPRTHAWQGYTTWVKAAPLDGVLSKLKKNYRGTVRRTLRKAEADGVRCEHVGPRSAEQAASCLISINREQWLERWQETGPEHWSDRFESHTRACARRMTASGLGGISEFRKGDEPIMSVFLLFARDFVGIYLIGAGKKAREQYTYSALFTKDMLDLAEEKGLPYVNFLLGEDAYKLRWQPELVHNHRAILGRGWLHWAPYAGYIGLRSRAVRYAKSEDAPGWARGAPAAYRRARYAAARTVGSPRLPVWAKKLAARRLKGV